MGCTRISDTIDKKKHRNSSTTQIVNKIDPITFQSDALERHNYYRTLHHSQPLIVLNFSASISDIFGIIPSFNVCVSGVVNF